MNYRWIRVTRANPCVICSKPDYCTYCPEHGLVLCMRVASNRPSRNSIGGWIHPMEGDETLPILPAKAEPPKPKLNVTKLMAMWSERTKGAQLVDLACKLGVSAQSLKLLGCAWAEGYKAFAFPMRDGWGEPVGIRLRADSGRKWAVSGSHNGLFISLMPPQRTAFFPEGPTDAAACITLGLFPIARPSCNGSLDQCAIACKRLFVQRAVIVTDNDDPGVNGSLALQKLLRIPSVIYVPPCKDLREGIKLGLTRELIEGTIKNLVWKQPQYQ